LFETDASSIPNALARDYSNPTRLLMCRLKSFDRSLCKWETRGSARGLLC